MPTPIAAVTLAAIECPRCGHDLRGVVESWRDACPLTGCCAECGVEFEWRHVAGSDRMPRWFVECERRRWFCGTRTFLRSLLPWRFWKQIRMTMPVRMPLWTYPLRLTAIGLFLGWLASGIAGARTVRGDLRLDPEAAVASAIATMLMPLAGESVNDLIVRVSPGWDARTPPAALQAAGRGWRLPGRASAYSPRHLAWGTLRQADPVIRWTFAALLISAATFAVMPIVRRRARVRWLHIVRAAVLGLALVILLTGAVWFDALEALRGNFDGWSLSSWRWRMGPRSADELLLLPVLLFFWWLCVSRRYLRLERPAAVAASVSLVGSLGSAALHLFVMPGEVVGWLSRLYG